MAYARGTLDGTIVAGQKAKWMVERFFNDFNKIPDEDYPYYIDWDELLKISRWAGLFKHRKGVLAGKPIELSDFQLFLLCNILCFKRKDNDYKRFREAYIQLARKQAKSQLLSIMTSYVSFLSNETEECYITGYAKEQSMLVYEEIVGQIEAANLLSGKYSTAYNKIRVYNNGSIIKPLSRESKKFGDGTNPSFVVVDEYHTHPDDEIVDVQRTGMMARPNPQIVYITTAGVNINSACKTYYDYGTRIINPEHDVENDNIFVAIFEIDEGDDIKDESIWGKANPLLVTYEEGMNSLRADLKMALDQPEKMRSFLTKNMNLWIDAKEDGYIELTKWNRAEASVDDVENILKNGSVFLGLDLSTTTDLTSIGLVGVWNGKFAVRQHSFIPESKFRERISRDRVRYDVFRDQGYLTLTEGDVVDYDVVKNFIVKYFDEYNVKECVFDPWNSIYLVNQLTTEGYPMVEMPQRITTLSEPTKSFRSSLYSGKVIHEPDGLLKWAVSNAIERSDPSENIRLDKEKSRDRIDPLAAIINAYGRAMYDDQTIDLNAYFSSDDFSF